jgi:hypothetical protein
VSLNRLHMAMNGGVADEDETLQDLGEDKTSKEVDKVSKETGLASEEARKGERERIKEKEKKRGEEETIGFLLPGCRRKVWKI